MNQEESEHNEVDRMKEEADSTGKETNIDRKEWLVICISVSPSFFIFSIYANMENTIIIKY